MAVNFFVSVVAKYDFLYIIPQVPQYKIDSLIIDLAFGPMLTKVQDVDPMIVMSTLYFLQDKL